MKTNLIAVLLAALGGFLLGTVIANRRNHDSEPECGQLVSGWRPPFSDE